MYEWYCIFVEIEIGSLCSVAIEWKIVPWTSGNWMDCDLSTNTRHLCICVDVVKTTNNKRAIIHTKEYSCFCYWLYFMAAYTIAIVRDWFCYSWCCRWLWWLLLLFVVGEVIVIVVVGCCCSRYSCFILLFHYFVNNIRLYNLKLG